jgi:hypothetical protein
MPGTGEREIEDLALVVGRLTQVAKILQWCLRRRKMRALCRYSTS